MVQMSKKGDSSIRQLKWMVASFSNFYCKTWVSFCINIRKRLFLEFSFWSQQKEHSFFEKPVLEIFKIALRLRDQHVFMWQSVKVSNVFNTLTLRQIFWKKKTFFQKLEHCFLVETTKIENISLPFKTAPSEANVKANRIATAKWTYIKKWSLPVTTLFFWKSCSSFRTS